MKITVGNYNLSIEALDITSNQTEPNTNDTIQLLTEISVRLYDAAKWERKKGDRFTAETTKMCADDITDALHKLGAL
jgi:hypothetical protein